MDNGNLAVSNNVSAFSQTIRFLNVLTKVFITQIFLIVFLLVELALLIGIGKLPAYSAFHMVLSHLFLLMIGFGLTAPLIKKMSSTTGVCKQWDIVITAVMWTLITGVVLSISYFEAMLHFTPLQSIKHSAFFILNKNIGLGVMNWSLVLVLVGFSVICYLFSKVSFNKQWLLAVVAVMLMMLAYLTIFSATFPLALHHFYDFAIEDSLLFTLTVPGILFANLLLRMFIVRNQWRYWLLVLSMIFAVVFFAFFIVLGLNLHKAWMLYSYFQANLFDYIFYWYGGLSPMWVRGALKKYTIVTEMNQLTIFRQLYIYFMLALYLPVVVCAVKYWSYIKSYQLSWSKFINVQDKLVDGAFYGLVVLIELALVLVLQNEGVSFLSYFREHYQLWWYGNGMNYLLERMAYIGFYSYLVFFLIMRAAALLPQYTSSAKRLASPVKVLVSVYFIIVLSSIIISYLSMEYWAQKSPNDYKSWVNPLIIWFLVCQGLSGLRFLFIGLFQGVGLYRVPNLLFGVGTYFICLPVTYYSFVLTIFHLWPVSYFLCYTISLFVSVILLCMAWLPKQGKLLINL